jgi:ABC-type uncharacterized transport system substrate-binding protein
LTFLRNLIALVLFFLISCHDGRKTIVYVNSYHEGYKPGDAIRNGIVSSMDSAKYELKIYYLDSKRLDEAKALRIADSVAHQIIKTDPSILLVSDDYAVSRLVKPNLYKFRMPVVYCGVNWSAAAYSLPSDHVTGMLEVLPLRESISFLRKYYPESSTITILSENSLSEQRNKELLDTLYKNCGLNPEYRLVENFDEWKTAFKAANRSSDLIYLPTNGSIKGWDNEEAEKFVNENIIKPVFTCDDFMMDYCVIGFTKVPEEQGKWTANTAMRLLQGALPSEIGVTKNTMVSKWLNMPNAEKIHFKPCTDEFKDINIIK